jgi:acetyl esterase
MPLDLALARLIRTKLAHTQAQQWELPIAQVRRAFRDFWTPAITGEPQRLDRIASVTIPGPGGEIGARAYVADESRRDPVMLYFHGGGYVKGGLDECDGFCRRLAFVTQHLVLSVDYRLAPEQPFPAAAEDCFAAASWASGHATELGGRAGALVLCGESAGGNLTAVTCLQARGDERLRIHRQILLQPVVDFTLSFPSVSMPETECLVPRADLAWYYDSYYGQRERRDPRVSPLYATDLSGLPEALIIAAEFDTLRDEAEAYGERLRASGVPATYRCYPGMVHGFLQMRGLVAAQADAALAEIAGALLIH